VAKWDRNNSSGGGFAGIPRKVMRTKDYRNLPGNAVKLLMALAYQYRRNNNGDLTAAHSILSKKFGFNSRTTIKKALSQLIDAGLVVRTRGGKFLNPGGRCALYAITWQPIDECNGKHDTNPTITPPRKFSMEQNK